MKLISFSRCWIGSVLQWLQPDTLGEWLGERRLSQGRKAGSGECRWVGVSLNSFNRWPLAPWNLLCLQSAVWTRNTGRGLDCTSFSGNRFRHLGWTKTLPHIKPEKVEWRRTGEIKTHPVRGPRLHSCCTGYSLRAAHPDHGWKKPVIASLHQLGPLKSPTNRLCVSGLEAGNSALLLHWEVDPSQTSGDKPRARNQRGLILQRLVLLYGVWWQFHLLLKARQGGVVGAETCPGFVRVAGLLVLLLGLEAEPG